MKRSLVLTAVAVLVVVGVLFVAVFPTRSLLDQRRARQRTAAEVASLSTENRQLQQRVQTLQTDAEIERLAREQYNLVRPGEEAYAILPPPRAPAPAQPPPAKQKQGPWWQRAWHTVASLL